MANFSLPIEPTIDTPDTPKHTDTPKLTKHSMKIKEFRKTSPMKKAEKDGHFIRCIQSNTADHTAGMTGLPSSNA
jgi:hypothetical protein